MEIPVEEYANESRREVSLTEVWKFEDVLVRFCRRIPFVYLQVPEIAMISRPHCLNNH